MKKPTKSMNELYENFQEGENSLHLYRELEKVKYNFLVTNYGTRISPFVGNKFVKNVSSIQVIKKSTIPSSEHSFSCIKSIFYTRAAWIEKYDLDFH